MTRKKFLIAVCASPLSLFARKQPEARGDYMTAEEQIADLRRQLSEARESRMAVVRQITELSHRQARIEQHVAMLLSHSAPPRLRFRPDAFVLQYPRIGETVNIRTPPRYVQPFAAAG